MIGNCILQDLIELILWHRESEGNFLDVLFESLDPALDDLFSLVVLIYYLRFLGDGLAKVVQELLRRGLRHVKIIVILKLTNKCGVPLVFTCSVNVFDTPVDVHEWQIVSSNNEFFA